MRPITRTREKQQFHALRFCISSLYGSKADMQRFIFVASE